MERPCEGVGVFVLLCSYTHDKEILREGGRQCVSLYDKEGAPVLVFVLVCDSHRQGKQARDGDISSIVCMNK